MKLEFLQSKDNRLEEFTARLIVEGVRALKVSPDAKKRVLKRIAEKLAGEGCR